MANSNDMNILCEHFTTMYVVYIDIRNFQIKKLNSRIHL